MAWLRIDAEHTSIVELLVTSARAASVAARSKTGPFNEIRQVVVMAASLGAALEKDRPIASAGPTQIRDTILFETPGAEELAFALAYKRSGWDLGVIADGDASLEDRLRAVEEFAAGGFDFMRDRLVQLGPTTSALELLLDVKRQVKPPEAELPLNDSAGRDEDPVIAALRRVGKLRPEAAQE